MKTVNERSTCVLTMNFTDEGGNVNAPESGTWTLTDDFGNIINARERVALPIALTIEIVLSGADLAFSPDASPVRVFTIEALYDSTLGAALPLNDEYRFEVTDLVAVT